MLVYDPFVGTGSILIAAAHHGAMTLGADIDPRVISVGKVCGKSLSWLLPTKARLWLSSCTNAETWETGHGSH